MNNKLSTSASIAIGFMLFALFFGAGNLIFPAQLGQYSGDHVWTASFGFLITGVGLPLLGILAIGFSGSKNLQELSSRVHPLYGLSFTILLYLTIGPFFAAPRTGTVAFEVGIASFVPDGSQSIALLIFTLIFFAIAYFFSAYPGKLVNNVGKIMAPILVFLLVSLLLVVIFKPMGPIGSPHESYETNAFINGFLEGYNTMDALASLVFGIIVIQAIRSFGVTEKRKIFTEIAKSGLVAIILLAVIYVGIAYLGATSTSVLELFDNGGPVLSGTAGYYFGTFGQILLAIVITLACLTTAIGLITANAEYFHTLLPRISYKTLVMFFSVITFIFANFGLTNIITFSLPVLMFLYPLAMVIMILTFASPFFNHKQSVYVATVGITFIISIFDGVKALYQSLGFEDAGAFQPIITFFNKYLPLSSEGLGWILPALVVMIITSIIARTRQTAQ